MTADELADDLEQALAAIPDEIRRETERSRFRDRFGARIHPTANDVTKLLTFVIARRRRQPPATFDAVRRLMSATDTDAIRLLVTVVLDGGCSWWMRRRCRRLLKDADALDSSRALLAMWRNVLRESESVREQE